VNHGNHRHAHIDLAAAHAEFDSPVLRQAFLGDVQPGHDFQPADDRRFEAMDFRRHRLQLQHPVNAVTDDQSRRLRLDMHVARLGLDGFQQDFVDQPDDRRLLRHFGQFRAVGLDALQQQYLVVVGGLGNQAFDRLAADAQVLFDQLGDLFPPGQDGRDEQACRGADLVQRIQVERIAGGDDQRPVGAANGEQRLAVDQLLRKIFQHLPQFRLVIHARQIDVIETDRLADCAECNLLADKTQLDRRVQHRPAAGLAGLVQLPLIQQTTLQQNLACIHRSNLIPVGRKKRSPITGA